MKFNLKLTFLFLPVLLSSCALTTEKNEKFHPASSYLEADVESLSQKNEIATTADEVKTEKSNKNYISLTSIEKPTRSGLKNKDVLALFSQEESLHVSIDKMPLNDFLHYAFGELLNVNYVLGDGVESNVSLITLNITKAISQKEFFLTIQDILVERDVLSRYQQNMFYLFKAGKGKSAVTEIGYGRSIVDIPNAVSVIQIVPLDFVFTNSLLKTLKTVTGAKVTMDTKQGVVVINGKKEQVVRAIELIDVLDVPNNKSKHIALLSFTYIDSSDFLEGMKEILATEGIASLNPNGDSRVGFVELQQLGSIVVFSSSEKFLQRIRYWAKQLDKPAKGGGKRYFVYTPKYARASDLGESLSILISGNSSAKKQQAQQSSTNKAAAIEGRAAATNTSASNDSMRMVVDERANTLIFHTSGTEYKSILPLIERLDVVPKQVLLEMSIVEVTLVDEFKLGVDILFSDGNFSFGSDFGASTIGGGVLNWASGTNKVDVNAFKKNNLVNTLSNPNILVRDGLSATIQVGNDIPLVGSTTTDPVNGTTRSIVYRKTGINLDVTPTINAQGVVIMNIVQSISNQSPGGTEVEGNPTIFERSISTEVVAESGQTIVLGGLISEDKTNNDTGIPFLRDIPGLGVFFGTETETTNKTELIIMVTPKIITNNHEWQDIKEKLSQKLDYILLN